MFSDLVVDHETVCVHHAGPSFRHGLHSRKRLLAAMTSGVWRPATVGFGDYSHHQRLQANGFLVGHHNKRKFDSKNMTTTGNDDAEDSCHHTISRKQGRLGVDSKSSNASLCASNSAAKDVLLSNSGAGRITRYSQVIAPATSSAQ